MLHDPSCLSLGKNSHRTPKHRHCTFDIELSPRFGGTRRYRGAEGRAPWPKVVLNCCFHDGYTCIVFKYV